MFVLCSEGIQTVEDAERAVALGVQGIALSNHGGRRRGGRTGVDHVLTILREGIERAMALTGRTSLAEIDRDLVRWRAPSA